MKNEMSSIDDAVNSEDIKKPTGRFKKMFAVGMAAGALALGSACMKAPNNTPTLTASVNGGNEKAGNYAAFVIKANDIDGNLQELYGELIDHLGLEVTYRSGASKKGYGTIEAIVSGKIALTNGNTTEDLRLRAVDSQNAVGELDIPGSYVFNTSVRYDDNLVPQIATENKSQLSEILSMYGQLNNQWVTKDLIMNNMPWQRISAVETTQDFKVSVAVASNTPGGQTVYHVFKLQGTPEQKAFARTAIDNTFGNAPFFDEALTDYVMEKLGAPNPNYEK